MQKHPERHFNYQLIIESILVGALASLGAVGYRFLLTYASDLSVWMYSQRHALAIVASLVFLIAAAKLTAWLLSYAPYSGGSGIPQVMGEFSGLMKMRSLRIIVSKYLGGLLSMIAGMSLGREGPSIQIGAAMGKWTSKKLGEDLTRERLLITAGAAAGLAAAFNAPIAATLFVLEEVHKNIGTQILLPAFIASLTSDYLSKLAFGMTPSFHIEVVNVLPSNQYLHLIGLGILCALVGWAFVSGLLGFQTLAKKYLPKMELRVLVGFVIAGVVGYFLTILTGSGHDLVETLLESPASLNFLLALLLGKLIFTCLSYDSGVPGGIFLPVLVLGSLTGMIYFQLVQALGMDVTAFWQNFVIFGMTGILTAVVRSPITSILLVSEMTGSLSHILSISIVAAVAYLLMEWLDIEPIYESLYERMFDRVKPSALDLDKVTLQYVIPSYSDLVGKKIKEMDLPADTLIVSMKRGQEDIIPTGQVTLLGMDKIMVLCNLSSVGQVRDYFRQLGEETVPDR